MLFGYPVSTYTESLRDVVQSVSTIPYFQVRKCGTLTREFLSWQNGGMSTVAFSWGKAVEENIESRQTGALSVFPKWGVRHTHTRQG
jgi:hypothetical protein